MNKKSFAILILFSIVSAFFSTKSFCNESSWNLFLTSILSGSQYPCEIEHLYQCKNIDSCVNADGYWYNNKCNISPPACSPSLLSLCDTKDKCLGASGFWNDDLCQKKPPFFLDDKSTLLTTNSQVSSMYKMNNTLVSNNISTNLFGTSNEGQVSTVVELDLDVYCMIEGPDGNVWLSLNSSLNDNYFIKVPAGGQWETTNSGIGRLRDCNQGGDIEYWISFDGTGNPYFMNDHPSGYGICRYLDTKFDLVVPHQSISIFGWGVSYDGDIFVDGCTEGLGDCWLRLYKGNGTMYELSQFGTPSGGSKIQRFPDERLYLADNQGILELDATDNGTLYEKCLIGKEGDGGYCGNGNSEITFEEVCAQNGFTTNNCTLLNGNLDKVFVTSDKSYGLYYGLFFDSNSFALWQFYPSFKYINTPELSEIYIVKFENETMYAYGKDNNSKKVLYKIDLITEGYVDLIKNYNVNIAAMTIDTDGKVWFSGIVSPNSNYQLCFFNPDNNYEIVITEQPGSDINNIISLH